MNVWWPVMIILGSAWVLPMLGARQAQLPGVFFVCVGCLWTVVFAFAPPMYDWGIRVRRKMGMNALADWGERMRPTLLPPVRLALLTMALISFVFAVV